MKRSDWNEQLDMLNGKQSKLNGYGRKNGQKLSGNVDLP